MRCSKCGSEETKVLESRLTSDGRCVRRRRICRECDQRYTTYEREENFVFHIKKKNGQIQPFQRDKVLRSIQIACQKRNIRIEQIEFILGKVESIIYETEERVISSRKLGGLVMDKLYELDKVAYVRFASVYRDFKDPNEFYSLLKAIS